MSFSSYYPTPRRVITYWLSLYEIDVSLAHGMTFNYFILVPYIQIFCKFIKFITCNSEIGVPIISSYNNNIRFVVYKFYSYECFAYNSSNLESFAKNSSVIFVFSISRYLSSVKYNVYSENNLDPSTINVYKFVK